MKKSNNLKNISLFLSSIIFITTLSVFISFLVNSNNIEKNKNDNINLINISLENDIINSKKINSIIKIDNSINGYNKFFSKELVKKNFIFILNDALNTSSEIDYPSNDLYQKIFFKIINNCEISFKIELTPKNNSFLKYLSKFRLIIK